jgi:hypothetical protein
MEESVQGLQAINSMDFIARALRGWSVPLVQPVAQSWQAFAADGQLNDEGVGAQLRYSRISTAPAVSTLQGRPC